MFPRRKTSSTDISKNNCRGVLSTFGLTRGPSYAALQGLDISSKTADPTGSPKERSCDGYFQNFIHN